MSKWEDSKLKIGAKYSHLNGYEWLMHHHPNMWNDLVASISAVNASSCKTKISKEKTMKGKMLYAPTALNKAFKVELNKNGWGKPKRYNFYMSADEQVTRNLLAMPIEKQKEYAALNTSSTYKGWNEADFLKNRVSLEVQFGKYSFVQFDMFIKHAANYMQGKIDLGIEIVPMKKMEEEMSSGPPAYEKHLHEILRQGRVFPPVPLILIGVEP